MLCRAGHGKRLSSYRYGEWRIEPFTPPNAHYPRTLAYRLPRYRNDMQRGYDLVLRHCPAFVALTPRHRLDERHVGVVRSRICRRAARAHGA